MSDYLVQFNNISKFFGKVIALKDVTMKLRKGEIMCLLGDNGAGKSTLIKTLAGVHKPDEGEIIFEGYCYSISRFSFSAVNECYKKFFYGQRAFERTSFFKNF